MTMSPFKYPTTPHLPTSPGAQRDDRRLRTDAHFSDRRVILTVKMDGENTSLYREGFHARSVDSRHHPSRDWLARFHASMAYRIPGDIRICGENLYARHSIAYSDLPSYFMGFSVWRGQTCLDWDTSLDLMTNLGITPVPLLYDGIYERTAIQRLIAGLDLTRQEGVVIRVASAFDLKDFGVSVAKYVRPGHVQTDSHWMHAPVVPNRLKDTRGDKAPTQQDGATVSAPSATIGLAS
ncbi:RNA ligase family protein [Bordetella sp. 02P26C-1]|uniref:RNA ligase family protein n=1 Tax=Bordetella sp. 02P26C-1 TaxID=2683195 RepID=UPI001353C3FF|nr:RNA ligase family protein [Bordetella sp. 02P26C-1]MVW77454.1 2'-5' RNA ligase [Bordetella sp. 02P26C-1]